MKVKKLILPMLAFICAIGMAFAAVNFNPEPKIQANDFVYLGNNSWKEIPEQNCQGTEENCRVQFGTGGHVYNVYDEMNLNTLKLAPENQEPTIINP